MFGYIKTGHQIFKKNYITFFRIYYIRLLSWEVCTFYNFRKNSRKMNF